MKRFFTFLATLLVLFSIVPKAMAEEVYLLTSETINGISGIYPNGNNYSGVPAIHKFSYVSGTEYKLTVTNMPSTSFCFRIGIASNQYQMQPFQDQYQLQIYGSDNVSQDQKYKVQNGCWGSKNAWKVANYSNYDYLEIHADINYSNGPYVWVVGKKYEQQEIYLLTSQNINGTVGTYDANSYNWKSEHKMLLVDGSTHLYKYDINSSDNPFSFRLGVKGWTDNNQMQPYINDTPLSVYDEGTTHSSYQITDNCYFGNKDGQKGNEWKVTYDAQKYDKLTVYVNIADYPDRSVWVEGTKKNDQSIFTLLDDGEEYASNKTGSFTYNLTDATKDAIISFKIGNDVYSLSADATVSAEGTTNHTATKGGSGKLTLTKGFAYTITIDGGGNVTVTAKKQTQYITADAGFYLVGNFFSPLNKPVVTLGPDEKDNINYSRLYFKFDKQKDGSYRMDIPACLTAKMQIMAVNADGKKTIYGPTEVYSIHGDGSSFGSAWPATNEAVSGTLLGSTTLSEGSNYWNLTTRNDGKTDDDGMYKVSFTLGENGVPSKWTITHDAKTRVAYLISTAYGATAQPVYNKRSGDQGGYSDNTEAFLHFDGKNSYYAIGYVVNDVGGSNVAQLEQAKKATPSIHATKSVNNNSGTHDKLFFLGNGGYEYNDNEHSKVWANQKPFTLNITGNKKVQYNPNRGFNDIAGTDGSYGSTGSIYIQNSTTVDYPNTISMVGTAIPGTTTGETWNWASTAADMIYDANERCYKLTLETKDEHQHQFFRFVGDHSQDKNWYEDTTTETAKKAGCDHENIGGHTCYPGDENIVSYTDNGTSTATELENGIMWNRAAGLHIVRFYITTDEDNKKVFKYSIESTNNITVSLTYRVDKFIRTYSNDVAMDIIDPRVKVYEAYKYTMPDQVENIYSQGTLELRQLEYIPANMGVVLIGTVPATGTFSDGQKFGFSIRKRTEKSAEKDEEYVDVWTKAADYKEKDEKWNNFLVPTVEAVPNLGNAEFDDAGNVTYRYFGLANFFRTLYYKEHGGDKDYIGFFRYTAKGASDANKAYLSLPTREDLKGGKYGYINYNGQLIGTKDEDNESLAKMMIVFDDEMGAVTEIKHIEATKSTDNAYYTLQGVKVLRPAKGIYIHNGKKIVFK